jgi:hypothetical protein
LTGEEDGAGLFSMGFTGEDDGTSYPKLSDSSDGVGATGADAGFDGVGLLSTGGEARGDGLLSMGLTGEEDGAL